MIQPLRRIHRGVFLVFGILLPIVFVSGLISRHRWPATGTNGQSAPPGSFLTEQTVVLDGRKTVVDLYSDAADSNSVQFRLAPGQSLVAPDVLVYWSEVSFPSALPSDARLLGSFNPTTRYRPPDQGRARGYMILYSVARQQALGSFSLER